MDTAKQELFRLWQYDVMRLLKSRGRNDSLHYLNTYTYERLADGALALAVAVANRVEQGGSTIETAQAFATAASTVALPPDGRTVSVSRNLYDAIIGQPTVVDGVLGPLPAATARVLAEAMRVKWIVEISALMTVQRTLGVSYLRRDAIGAHDKHQATLSLYGHSPENGGTSLLLISHNIIQDPAEEAPEALVAYGADEIDPVGLRAELLAAAWREFHAVLGVKLPMIIRGERRFRKDVVEASVTEEDAWYVTDQPEWRARFVVPTDAILLAELGPGGLHDWIFEHDGSRKRISRTETFMTELELYPHVMGARYLRMRDPADESDLGEPDDMIVVDGLVDLADDRYTGIIVRTRSFFVTYVIPAELSASFTGDDWDAVRRALAPLHGGAGGASSEDQGLAWTEPRKHLQVSSSNLDKSTNIDTFAATAHALTSPRHWHIDPDSPPPGHLDFERHWREHPAHPRDREVDPGLPPDFGRLQAGDEADR